MNSDGEESASVSRMLIRSASAPDVYNERSELDQLNSKIGMNGQLSGPAGVGLKSVTIGLVDCLRLTRECLINALNRGHPEIKISSFADVQDRIDGMSGEFDLFIYCLHDNDVSGRGVTQTVATINRTAPNTPVLVFSYFDRARDQTILRSILESGARGFVPAQTATLSIIWAAINLINAGGTYLPPDLLLTNPRDHAPERMNRLTSRQSAVFDRLRLGQANKIIARELGMCESTVKVHVKSIMRKLGATNRTQAAYLGQRFLNASEVAKLSTGVD